MFVKPEICNQLTWYTLHLWIFHSMYFLSFDFMVVAANVLLMFCFIAGEWTVPEDFSVAPELLSESPQGTETPPTTAGATRDTSTPMSDSGSVSEASINEITNDLSGSGRKGRRGRTTLDPAAAAELEKSSKIRSLLTAGSKEDLR